MIGGRHAFLLFTGGLDLTFGALFILLGVTSIASFTHGGVGSPIWAGIGLVMIGFGNLIIVATRPSKKRSREFININFGALLLNMMGVILAACVIGFYTWGAWSVLTQGLNTSTEDAISLYAAIILMAVIIFIISLMAMFMDCCSYALFGMGGDYGPPRPRYYDGHYGPPPSHIYKP